MLVLMLRSGDGRGGSDGWGSWMHGRVRRRRRAHVTAAVAALSQDHDFLRVRVDRMNVILLCGCVLDSPAVDAGTTASSVTAKEFDDVEGGHGAATVFRSVQRQ